MKKRYLTTKDGDVRPLTEEDFKLFRPLRESDPAFLARFAEAKRKRGRPP